MSTVSAFIQVGRVVHYFAGYGGTDCDGAIVAVHGTPNSEPARSILGGIGRVIRPNDCTVDVILLDGRRLLNVHQCSINGVGIGVKLVDETIGADHVAKLHVLAAQREADEAIKAARDRATAEGREAARVIVDAPVFFWNGIKDAKGAKLQKCWYSPGALLRYPEGTITIYAKNYERFSEKVRACFTVHNDTDTMTDYFDSDTIRVIPAHPLYAEVRAAMLKQDARRA